MNWYKQSQANQTENIAYDIYSKISDNIEGSWTILSDTKMMPTFQLQSYRIIKLDGKDVKRVGDYFWIEVKIFIYKALNILHPWSGTYENAENWQQGVASKLKDYGKHTGGDWKEEETKRWEALKKLKPEDSSTYDDQYGNKLIEFHIQVYGKKPDGKAAPTSVDKLKLFFEKGDVERIGVSHKGHDTPSEIAQYVQTTIDNYYKGDNDENDRVEPINPTGGGYMEPEVTYDQIDSPVFAPSLAQHKNWYKKAQVNNIKIPLQHGTTTLAIVDGRLSHPQGKALFFAEEGDPDVRVWADEIVGEYGGEPLLLTLPPQNIQKYNFSTPTNELEQAYYTTYDSMDINDFTVEKI